MSASQMTCVTKTAANSESVWSRDGTFKEWMVAAAECSGGVSVVYPGGRLDLEL